MNDSLITEKPNQQSEGLINQLNLDLSAWFLGRPKWLQTVASCFFDDEKVTDSQIEYFVKLCVKEAEGEQIDNVNIDFSKLFNGSSEHPIHLCAISNIEGINALAPTKPLEFGEKNLSVVYGYGDSSNLQT